MLVSAISADTIVIPLDFNSFINSIMSDLYSHGTHFSAPLELDLIFLLGGIIVLPHIYTFFTKRASDNLKIVPTLCAHLKLSITIYNAIINAFVSWEKPRTADNGARAVIIAPPGTPGAATIATANVKINAEYWENDISIPVVYITANEQATILSIEPERLIVAHSGTAKLAIEFLTPFDKVDSSVTGIVAAEEEVPRAVI